MWFNNTSDKKIMQFQVVVFKDGYENIDCNIFFLKKAGERTVGHDLTLMKEQSRLDVRKYSFFQMTIKVWNQLSLDCEHASSVNMFRTQ